jgi:hypothetical protein
MPHVGQVQYYLEVQRVSTAPAHRAAAASSGNTDGSNTDQGSNSPEEQSQLHSVKAAVAFAVMKYYKPASDPVTRFEHPQIAEVMFEGRPEQFQSNQSEPNGKLEVVPLQLIHAPLHCHRYQTHTGLERMTFVPLLSRSKRVICSGTAAAD